MKTDTPFYVLPRDAGQLVERSYAVADAGETLVLRIQDGRRVEYLVADINLDAPEEELLFEPWNGRLPAHWPFEFVFEEGI